MNNITQELVQELFDYNPETGKLIWKVRRSGATLGREVGHINDKGYRRVSINKKQYKVHRVVWLWMTGAWPKRQIDHINMIKDDNRWCNLREATPSENMMNKRKHSNNTSGHKNIHRRVRRQWIAHRLQVQEWWRVRIKAHGTSLESKFPYTEAGLQRAIKWRDQKLSELHQDFARFD